MAAVDYFLKIDGITGESKDAKHKGAIQLSSWAWGAKNTGTMQFGGGGGGGRAVFKNFRFTMPASAATPKLMQALASGEHIPTATLICRKAGKTPHEYLKITFENVIVARYKTLGGFTDDALPRDAISLNFGKVTFEYREQKADGTLGGAIVAAHDMQPLLGAPIYEKDVHQTLTEVLALAAGFSIAEAGDIGGANQAVDDDLGTTPMPQGVWDEVSGAGAERRRQWHFTTDARLQEVKHQYQRSGSLEDLGRYMHVFQDQYSHEGLGARAGQVGTYVDSETGRTMRGSSRSGRWHEADQVYQKPLLSLRMARDSYRELLEARNVLARDRKLRKVYKPVDESRFDKLLVDFCHEKNDDERLKIARKIGEIAFKHQAEQDKLLRR